jgi:hypothetical protein
MTSHVSIQPLQNHFSCRYQILIDGEVKASGDLLEETAFQPPFQPPKEIDDPEDKKPSDWVDDEM